MRPRLRAPSPPTPTAWLPAFLLALAALASPTPLQGQAEEMESSDPVGYVVEPGERTVDRQSHRRLVSFTASIVGLVILLGN